MKITFSGSTSVKNIGCGPALHLRLAIRFQHNSADQPQAELAPLGTNEQIASSIKIPIFLGDDFNRMDYEVAPGEVWELRLTYEDVFGNVFHTRHSKNPQLPWTVLGKGEPLN